MDVTNLGSFQLAAVGAGVPLDKAVLLPSMWEDLGPIGGADQILLHLVQHTLEKAAALYRYYSRTHGPERYKFL